MAPELIRVGFIGAGNNTCQRHIPGFRAQPGVELGAVANRTKESGERVAQEFGIAKVYENWRDLLTADNIDAVCIGTWPSTHCEITLAALQHGKHVLCEARMAMDPIEGRRMLQAEREAPHLVAQLVPSPLTLELDATLQELLASGYVGEVLTVELTLHNGHFVDREGMLRWREDRAHSGLNVLAMGIWYESMMRWLGPAHRVMAMTKVTVPRRLDSIGTWHDVTVPDHVDILATFGDGAVAHLRFSAIMGLAPPSDVWIFGSEGTLRLEGTLRGEDKRLWGGQRGDAELGEIVVPAERRIGWRVEEEFVNAIRGEERVSRTTFEDGVRYMEFSAAVAASSASGQAVDVANL